MGLFDKIKNNAIDIVTSSVTGNPYGITCAYACPETDWNPTPPWTAEPITVIPDSVPEKNEETEPKKNVDYYKKQFVTLFNEMEEQLGRCKHVEIKKDEKILVNGGEELAGIVEIDIEF